MRVLIATCLLFAVAYGAVSYRDYKVYTVQPLTEVHKQILLEWERNGKYDFWSHIHANQEPVDIMVPPMEQPEFEMYLKEVGMQFFVKIEDVQELIENEQRAQIIAKARSYGRMNHDRYLRYPEILSYMDQLAQKYPDKVTVETYGESFEGRPLKALRVSKGGDGTRPAIFIDGGIHAREWIAPAMALYIMEQVVEKQDFMADALDWIIIPVANPDGYEYTHTNDRLWRKTRSITSGNACPGADGNRNYGYKWAVAGSSTNPCSETYHGTSAFSEAESRSLAELAEKDADRIKFYLSFHSFGKYILYPWGFTSELPEDDALLRGVAEIGHEAIKSVKGTHYTVGATVEVMYYAAGGSHDHMKGALGIELSYTLELPGGGLTGFDLPPTKIYDVVTETFEAVYAWHKYVASNL